MKRFIMILLSVFALSAIGQVDPYINSGKVPAFIRAEMNSVCDTLKKTIYWSYNNSWYGAEIRDSYNAFYMAFDTMQVEKITIDKIPDAVKQKFRAWTICSGDSCTYGLMYAPKQGYYILSSDCVLNGIQICYDSMANMKYCLVITDRVIEIPMAVINAVLKLHPSTKTIVWGDEGMDWINGYEFMKSGHYEVSFDITEDSSWTVEFDSLGNKCRSVLELTDKDDSQLPVGIHQYMTSHYKSDYKYFCQMDTSQPDKRYIDELDVYMDANDSVLYYGFAWDIKRWLIIDKECIMLFNKQGEFVGKHNIHTPMRYITF